MIRHLDENQFERGKAFLARFATREPDAGGGCLNVAVDVERCVLEVLPLKHRKLVSVQAVREKDGTVFSAGAMLLSLLDVALYPVWSGWREAPFQHTAP